MSEHDPNNLDPHIILDMRLSNTKRSKLTFTGTLPHKLFDSTNYYNPDIETFSKAKKPFRTGYKALWFYDNLFIRIKQNNNNYLGRIIAIEEKSIIMDLMFGVNFDDDEEFEIYIYAKHKGILESFQTEVLSGGEKRNRPWTQLQLRINGMIMVIYMKRKCQIYTHKMIL